MKTLTSYKKWCKQQRKIDGTQEWLDSEIRATIQHALGQKNNDIDSAILQVTCLRLAYNLNHSKCVAAMLKSIIETSCSDSFKHLDKLKLSKVRLSLGNTIKIWAPYIVKFGKGTVEENVFLTDYLENYCRYRFYEYPKVFKFIFPCILHQLYMHDILEEDGLLVWKDVTEESISDTSSSGGSVEEIQDQIKNSVAALTAAEPLFIWFETASSESD